MPIAVRRHAGLVIQNLANDAGTAIAALGFHDGVIFLRRRHEVDLRHYIGVGPGRPLGRQLIFPRDRVGNTAVLLLFPGLLHSADNLVEPKIRCL